MGLTDTIRTKVNSLFDFDSQQQSNQLKKQNLYIVRKAKHDNGTEHKWLF